MLMSPATQVKCLPCVHVCAMLGLLINLLYNTPLKFPCVLFQDNKITFYADLTNFAPHSESIKIHMASQDKIQQLGKHGR